MQKSHILRLKITDLVSSPFQGRLYDLTDELTPEEETSIDVLKESIENNGLLQPIVVRPSSKEEGKHEVIDGHRRVIAHRKLGFGQIKTIVRGYGDQWQLYNIVKKQNLNHKQVTELIKERQQKDKKTEENKPRVNMNLKNRVHI